HEQILEHLDQLDPAVPTVFFCNGPQCTATPDAIGKLLDAGYPAEAILYYRGGIHDWMTLGFPVSPGPIASDGRSRGPRETGSRAGGHHQTLERGEAHRRRHGPAVLDRGQRGARPQVAADDPQTGGSYAEQLGGPAGHPRMGEPVEAVALDRPPLPPRRREGI